MAFVPQHTSSAIYNNTAHCGPGVLEVIRSGFSPPPPTVIKMVKTNVLVTTLYIVRVTVIRFRIFIYFIIEIEYII